VRRGAVRGVGYRAEAAAKSLSAQFGEVSVGTRAVRMAVEKRSTPGPAFLQLPVRLNFSSSSRACSR